MPRARKNPLENLYHMQGRVPRGTRELRRAGLLESEQLEVVYNPREDAATFTHRIPWEPLDSLRMAAPREVFQQDFDALEARLFAGGINQAADAMGRLAQALDSETMRASVRALRDQIINIRIDPAPTMDTAALAELIGGRMMRENFFAREFGSSRTATVNPASRRGAEGLRQAMLYSLMAADREPDRPIAPPAHPDAGKVVPSPRLLRRTVGGEKAENVRQLDGSIARTASHKEEDV